MLDQGDQDFLSRLARARVTHDDGQPGIEVKRNPDILERVAAGALEDVERDDERDLPALEVVDSREAVGEPPGVSEHQSISKWRCQTSVETEAVASMTPRNDQKITMTSS